MKKKKSRNSIYKSALWLAGMIIIICTAVSWYRVIEFNNNFVNVKSTAIDSSVYIERSDIDEYNDSWETIIQQSDNPEDCTVYTGVTCSANIVNKNKFNIEEWQLTLHIKDECYLSGFWCGSFDVYQFRDGNTIQNRINSQQEDISKISNIDRNGYTDSMMIHLLPGDYLVYTPSVDEKEDVVKAYDSVGIGYIFYYNDSLDLSDWELTYKNSIRMRDILSFRIIVALMLLWVSSLGHYLSMVSTEKRIKKQMNSRIKNISIMTDLYIEAYIVDMGEDTAQLIKGNEEQALLGLKGANVQEVINSRITMSCDEDYRDELSAFMDLKTVTERMGDLSSISLEFPSVNHNWYAIRIFRVDDSKNKQVVLTIQDINEEKKKIRVIEDRINMAEYKQNVSGSFLGTVSFALNDISAKIGDDAKSIMSNSTEMETKELSDRILMNTRHMNLIQNTMLDLYEIECKKLSLNIHPYNIYEMLAEVKHILDPFAIGKDFEFTFDIDNNIPAMLNGDSDRIEQILVIILFSSILMTEKGFVKLSVFGKTYDNEEEIIFSMRDSAKGFTEEQLEEIHMFINGASIETFDNASLVYHKIINGILNCMGSELKIVSVINEGTDFYFTVRQKIADSNETEAK